MKRFFLALLIIPCSLSVFSQKLYFIYLQSENDQPFFVKLNERVFSSTVSGYLILSKLHDSAYAITVGFPQNKYPEQVFPVEVKGKDHGYLLKDFGNKGWGLFDLQALSVLMALPVKSSSQVKPETENENVSAFTEILSRAANDPSLRQRPIMVRNQDKQAVIQPAVLKEEVKLLAGPAVRREQKLVIEISEPSIVRRETLTPKEELKNPVTEYKKSMVTKKAESSFTGGFGLVFVDEYSDGRKDTIRIVIPNPKTRIGEAKEPSKKEAKFLDISFDDTTKHVARVKTEEVKISAQNAAKNAGCSSLVSENDFSKLQKKMLAEKNNDDMIDEAKKVFKIKCVTSAQLKSLCGLLNNDDGRYKLFDAAYPFIADPENFPSLSSELKDEYYVNRFRAMLR